MLILCVVLLQADNYINDLTHLDPEIRKLAAISLGKKKEKRAVPYLIQSLTDSNEAVKKEAYTALKLITEKDHGPDQKKWQEWWDKEGKNSFGILFVQEMTLREVQALKAEVSNLKNVREQIMQDMDKLSDKVSKMQGEYRTLSVALAISGGVFLIIMFGFAVYLTFRIRTMREISRQADLYINEMKSVTGRIDKILAEIDTRRDTTKTELHDFADKLKGQAKDEMDRYSEILQENSDHHSREAIMELRQKAEKELYQTLSDLKKQLDYEIRKLFEAHKEKAREEL